MKKITAILMGAGDRGLNAYAPYALKFPENLQFVAVAEPDPLRRAHFAALHKIPMDRQFSDYKQLLDLPQMADMALICTQDRMHLDPTLKSLEKGYHVLLEKPMSTSPLECLQMQEAANKHQRMLSICHVLRYTNFFSSIKKLLDDGAIGQLVSIQHNENVGYFHQAHSYVRGNWRNSKESSPMILAKSCHDMDILHYLAGSPCKNIVSFGSLMHFKAENAPEGAPNYCLDGCPIEDTCAFYAPKQYLTDNVAWPTSVISNDTSHEARWNALKNGPYGRCVYKCDNDVVDHQVVSIEFENGITAAFTMSAFTMTCTRTIKLMGTKGEIRGSMERNEIQVHDFETGNNVTINLSKPISGHGGGDFGIISDYVKRLQVEDCKGLTTVEHSVESHLMAFAAEKSRIEGGVVNLKKYMQMLKDTPETHSR